MAWSIWTPTALIALLLVENTHGTCAGATSFSTCVSQNCCTGGPPCEWMFTRKRDNTAPEDGLLDDYDGDRKRQPGTCQCNSCCPVDCTVSMWSNWSSCSMACGTGTRSRSRTVQTFESCGGTCSPLNDFESCNTAPCPTNCQVSQWSGWTCSTACGPGTETRTRYITMPATNGGTCPEASSLSESRACDAGCCPSNCVVGGWSTWSGCSVGCGGGSQFRSRSITPASCGGSCSESETLQSQSCNTGCCPVNCNIGAWSGWSACTAQCGGGTQSRSRSITPASCGGSCSTSVVNESQSCNNGCCPQHCQVNGWSQWSACSQQCGGGTRSRNRAVTVVSACGGNACPSDLSESESCGGSCCAVNCVLNPWSSWSSCSATCGGGTRSRSRTKSSAESCGGTCDVLNESEPCSTGCCPSNCVWAAFGAWSGCSVTCGMGTQTRTRAIQTAEACGGSCPGNAMELQPCTQPACALPPVDCQVSQWAAWSACSATCGTSVTKSRTRSVTRVAANGGVPCPTLMDSADCGLGCCPVDCAVSPWTTWSVCSVTCGSGTRSRSRIATTDAACGGTSCPHLSESVTCSSQTTCVSVSSSTPTPNTATTTFQTDTSASVTATATQSATTQSGTQSATNTIDSSSTGTGTSQNVTKDGIDSENKLPQSPEAIDASSTDIVLIASIAGAIGALIIIAIIVVIAVCISRRRGNTNDPPAASQANDTSMAEFVSARESNSIAKRTHTYGNLPTQTNYMTSAHALSHPAAQSAHYNTLDATEI
jgi:hypothetical protein